MSESSIAFVDRLLAAFPGLRDAYAEHLSDNFGEVLPHGFLWEVVRYATALYLMSSAAPDPRARQQAGVELRAMLDYIENEYVHGNEEIRELIGVSFLESLPSPDEEAADIRSRLGPVTRGKLEEIWPST